MSNTHTPEAFRLSSEAMNELSKWESCLTTQQKAKLLNARISKDGEEWCILSGPDLTFDRAGFGKTISEALSDYVSIYVKKAS